MANKVFKFDGGCQLALNLRNVSAVDVSKLEDKWCLRIFIPGSNGGYNLCTPDKETADRLYELVTKAMEEASV